MTYLILLLALTALIFGANILVRGAVSLAATLGVPTFVIGLTIVAWSTSAPELVVSLTAGLQGEYGIALGNIIGSNLANILLIGGLAAVLIPLSTASQGLRLNALLLLFISLVLIAMVASGYLNAFVGAGLIALKAVSLYLSFTGSGQGDAGEPVEPAAMTLLRAAALVLGGAVLVGVGGFSLVDSATDLAELWELPSAVIGLSVVALGTSLPELMATIAAARQRQGDLIIGNIIGSNIANILIVLGFTALLAPGRLSYGVSYLPVLTLMLLSTLALVGFVILRQSIGRRTGLVLLLTYTLFVVASFETEAGDPFL